MVLQSVIIHIMPYGASMNLPTSTAALIAMFIPLSSVVGRLSGGWLADAFDSRRILVVSFIFLSLGLALLYFGHNLWQYIAFLAFSGPAFGVIVVLRTTVIRKYFGHSAFGSTQGIIIGVMTIGGIIGPAFTGWIFDTRGSYQAAWLIFTLATLATAVIILVTGQKFWMVAPSYVGPTHD